MAGEASPLSITGKHTHTHAHTDRQKETEKAQTHADIQHSGIDWTQKQARRTGARQERTANPKKHEETVKAPTHEKEKTLTWEQNQPGVPGRVGLELSGQVHRQISSGPWSM